MPINDVTFRSLAVGAIFAHFTPKGDVPEFEQPQVIYIKVNARHCQKGLRYPDNQTYIFPPEGEKIRTHSPTEGVIPLALIDDPPFMLKRKAK